MMEKQNVADDCTGCSACVNICPISCISMKIEKGFLYPHVDTSKCINCHSCENVCILTSGQDDIKTNDVALSEYYAAWARKGFMDNMSTSGGIISLLSRNFVDNGKVCAACFEEGVNNLHHEICGDPAKLGKFSGSKYLQSNIGLIYRDIERELKLDTRMLFIGTPCQVFGLKKYLRYDYQNLFTIDFFCHGIPSPIVWEKYVTYLEEKYKCKLKNYNFRSKKNGWGKIDQEATFSKSVRFVDRGKFNAFHSWFGHHWSIRNSCFHCKFRSENRVSDITVGDFWHIENYYPQIHTEQGVSCVIINSQNGKKLFDESMSKKQIEAVKVSRESIFVDRKTALFNFEEPEKRKEFMEDLELLSPLELVKKYPTPSYWQLVSRKVKCILNRK